MGAVTGEKVSRVYTDFRGVDFRGAEVSVYRSPDALNMWRDYTGSPGICTRPSERLVQSFDGYVWGVFFGLGAMFVHCGEKLYKVTNGKPEVIFSQMFEFPSKSFVFGDSIYFLDGSNYLVYHGYGSAEAVVGYVPTTSISRNAQSGGEMMQDVNLLTPRRKNTFIGDGEGVEFWLDTEKVDSHTSIVVKVDGVTYTEDQYVFTQGGNGKSATINFNDPPPEPSTVGNDNIEIEFSVTTNGDYSKISTCTVVASFDNRIFFSGGTSYPNRVYYCALNDPTYVQADDYFEDGTDRALIRGIVPGNNALWVFREPSDTNATIFYHTPLTDEDYGKIYPSSHSSISLGCVGSAINFGDDIVFFSDRGMEGISGDITSEQVIAHRSTMVDRIMLAHNNYGGMVLAEWRGYLAVCIGKSIYLADSRAIYTNINHNEYEWFYFELDHNVNCAVVHEDQLYFGTSGGVYCLDGDGDVKSHWVTPKDHFEAKQYLKTTNKRGCVIEAVGDFAVATKVTGKEYEANEAFEDVDDYKIARIRVKKFKDLQVKLYSDTRFSLESMTLEAYIGGFIKR